MGLRTNKQLLNSASIGAGDTLKLDPILGDHGCQVVFTGSSTVVVVDLEGSMDGVTWFQLMRHSFSGAEITAKKAMFFNATPQPVEFVRANLITNTGDGNVIAQYGGA